MKALKTLVIVMGILLAAGMGLLVWGISTRIGGGKTAATAPTPATTAVDTFDVPLVLAEGARIDSVSVAGERVIVRVSGSGGDEILVLDPTAGRVAGRFTVTRKAR